MRFAEAFSFPLTATQLKKSVLPLPRPGIRRVTLAGHPLGEPTVRETATGSEVTGPALREWLGATRLVAGERVVIRRVAPDQCRLSPGGGTFRFIDLFAGIGKGAVVVEVDPGIQISISTTQIGGDDGGG